jgi:hypothetical protein
MGIDQYFLQLGCFTYSIEQVSINLRKLVQVFMQVQQIQDAKKLYANTKTNYFE